jgi:hypothetical protein
MQSSPATPAQPEAPGHVRIVGRDRDGRWVVREEHGLIEGLFVSRSAALHFARLERHAFPGARIEMAVAPLSSILAA